MPVPLPYPKRPMPHARPPGLGAGLPKFKRLFDQGGQPPTAPTLGSQPPSYAPDTGPMSPRAGYVRFLSAQNVREPHGLAAQLLQVLQGGGRPLDRARTQVLRQIVSAWLGDR